MDPDLAIQASRHLLRIMRRDRDQLLKKGDDDGANKTLLHMIRLRDRINRLKQYKPKLVQKPSENVTERMWMDMSPEWAQAVQDERHYEQLIAPC